MKQMEWVYSGVGFAFVLSFVTHPDLFDPPSMAGKRVLLTGLQSDIGRATAYQYASLGAALLLVADSRATPPGHRHPLANDTLRSVADRCLRLGARSVRHLRGDLSQEQFRARVIANVQHHLGGLDHLLLHHVRSAPYRPYTPHRGFVAFANSSGALLNSDFVAYVDLATKALPLLSASGGGAIGVVSPLFGGKIPRAGLDSAPGGGTGGDWALHGFFPSLRQELASRRHFRVSVTSVALGFVESRTDPEYTAIRQDSFFYDYVVTTATEAALKVVMSVAVKKKEITFPFSAQVHAATYGFFPSLYELLVSATS